MCGKYAVKGNCLHWKGKQEFTIYLRLYVQKGNVTSMSKTSLSINNLAHDHMKLI